MIILYKEFHDIEHESNSHPACIYVLGILSFNKYPLDTTPINSDPAAQDLQRRATARAGDNHAWAQQI
jgi:hypothetical protein